MTNSKKENNLEPAKTFGERLRAIRKSLKLRQTDFVRGLELTSQHLSEIEKGKTKPCHDFFYNIVKIYNVNLYYLLFGDGEMFGVSGGAIEIAGKEIKTGEKKIDDFLYYFFHSHMAQNYLLYHFRKFIYENESNLKKDLERSKDEE
jgi:transcriptional regulator with XRE-family HTH domain